MLKRLIIGGEPSEKKLFFWNMMGSGVYAFTSLILTYMTIRFAGDREGGVFAIALTLAQMFIYIAYYEMRNYQVTDAKDRFSFSQYHAVKIINCFVMMVIVAGYILVMRYDMHKAIIVFLVCFYRMLDGYSDVYEAEFHKRGRLDLAGKSMTFRSVISVAVYFIILIITGDLLWSVIGAIVSGLIGIGIFNLLVFDCVGKISVEFKGATIKNILTECFPLFVGMFLWTYLLSASRIAVDAKMASEFQSYYQVLFMPVSVINLFAGFLIRPSLLGLTEQYANGDMKPFWKTIRKMVLLLVAFTVVCMAGAYICGIPVLEVLVKCDLKAYRIMFVFLIFAGGINALVYLLYYIMTIFRAGKGIMIGYITSSVIAFFISGVLTEKHGLWGASWSYLISVGYLMLFFVIWIVVSRARKE
ncbi:MAG: hypothetical protein K6G63_05495 [Eubacterium sp.]|nr:hypothetical protein [Eubacterium sp.]